MLLRGGAIMSRRALLTPDDTPLLLRCAICYVRCALGARRLRHIDYMLERERYVALSADTPAIAMICRHYATRRLLTP